MRKPSTSQTDELSITWDNVEQWIREIPKFYSRGIGGSDGPLRVAEIRMAATRRAQAILTSRSADS